MILNNKRDFAVATLVGIFIFTFLLNVTVAFAFDSEEDTNEKWFFVPEGICPDSYIISYHTPISFSLVNDSSFQKLSESRAPPLLI